MAHDLKGYPIPTLGPPFTNAFPFWQGITAGSVPDVGVYNAFILDGNWLGIIGPPSPTALEGDYSAYIQADVVVPGNSASLSQVGEIPSGSKSLRFTTSRDPIF